MKVGVGVGTGAGAGFDCAGVVGVVWTTGVGAGVAARAGNNPANAASPGTVAGVVGVWALGFVAACAAPGRCGHVRRLCPGWWQSEQTFAFRCLVAEGCSGGFARVGAGAASMDRPTTKPWERRRMIASRNCALRDVSMILSFRPVGALRWLLVSTGFRSPRGATTSGRVASRGWLPGSPRRARTQGPLSLPPESFRCPGKLEAARRRAFGTSPASGVQVRKTSPGTTWKAPGRKAPPGGQTRGLALRRLGGTRLPRATQRFQLRFRACRRRRKPRTPAAKADRREGPAPRGARTRTREPSRKAGKRNRAFP